LTLHGDKINAIFEIDMMQRSERIVVIGAGIGGLVSALELAQQGCEVTVVERASAPGGKMRTVEIQGRPLDVGPTVFTMRWVFEEIFANADASLAEHLTLKPVEVLARHAWENSPRLDLFANIARSVDAIGSFAGLAEAGRYVEFCKRSRATYETLKNSYILAAKPSPLSLASGAGLKGIADLWRISPFTTLWSVLGGYFHDARLRQLFGRYATYCGSSPFEAPATLMLVAHVERDGVWVIEGGMRQLAAALESLGRDRGIAFRYGLEAKKILVSGGSVCGIELGSEEQITCNAVVVNADAAALASGLLGHDAARAIKAPQGANSLSAVTWALVEEVRDFPLARHNVFFSNDYEAEFDDIFHRHQLPSGPTVYVCAEDREENGQPDGRERLFALVNAPATGDAQSFDKAEIDSCTKRAFGLLQRCGLEITSGLETAVTTTPRDFASLFPGTGGSLYGQASHGWAASFARPTAKTLIPGLYLAGGSAHPGPGVPMAAISGRLAAAQVLSDLRSMRRLHGTAMPGGTSMR
jgi:1-hydroxycarotenoid 3,4-desaturase